MTLAVPPAHVRRIAYLGTPAVAVPALQALHHAGYEIAVVITNPDKRRGRGGHLVPSPVKQAALDLGLDVRHELDALAEVDVDLGVVVAYGRLIPAPLLRQVPLVNIHFSLLPRWRGAAPVERALLAGDDETGVCLMVVDDELDTGAVYQRITVPIEADDTLDSLRDRLVAAGSDLLVGALAEGLGQPESQEGVATYAAKIDPAELHIDWEQPAATIERLVRLGGAWSTFRDKRLKIWAVEVTTDGPGPAELDGLVVGCGEGAVALATVQPEGKGRMDAGSWRNGVRPEPGERLGS